MGYYDEPTWYDLTVSFTCSNKECEEDYKDYEVSVIGHYTSTVEVDCDKCGSYTTVELETEEDFCRCGDKCYC